ncbi:MAG: dihydroorotate dehydrogenase [Gemmatimonadota bacterium]|nr:MAG: dihydroorotate dehydrogenase [Gemmatimonadota bacterium]
MSAPSLRVDFGKFQLRNPLLAASGAFGYGAEYREFIDNATIGGFVTKSVTPQPRRGNPHPRVAETPAGMLNSIGLENLGIDHFLAHEWPEVLKEPCVPILSVAAYSPDEYVEMCAKAQAAGGVQAIEVNLSCPNVKEGGRTFGADPGAVEAILRRCRQETDAFLIAKLTPNADPVAIAQGAEAGGADGLSLINTLLGMGIDVERRRPLLAMGMGGLSGPAVKPVALAMVYRVCRSTSLPVIGIGGIATWQDVVEFLLAGARAVQVGTALFSNPLALAEMIDGITDYCVRHGHDSVEELIGALSEGDLITEGKYEK